MNLQPSYWTNPSVLLLASGRDPITGITEKAREIVLNAIDEGWLGPPFDPFKLADYLKVPVWPREDVLDARIVPAGHQAVRVEFNPNRPRGRMRFSVAHELAHTLFPDCGVTVRNRAETGQYQADDWQLEMLCNIAAAEFLMPVGTAINLANEIISIENLLRLQREFDVSAEALFIRVAKLTNESCAMFTASRTKDEPGPQQYRIDYSISSRSCPFTLSPGLLTSPKTVLSECTAVGFTAKGKEHWASTVPECQVECVGIPAFPGFLFPRVLGIVRSTSRRERVPARINYLRGNATEPRGNGRRIIAQIVNDKTPNWGAGFARVVRNKWGFVQDDFRKWATSQSGNLLLGNVHVSVVSKDLSIVHMVAQHGYGPATKPRIRYRALAKCLDQLAGMAREQKATVHMPRIGTGQAGGDWGIIEESIDEALCTRGVEVTVYDLPGTEAQKAQRTLSLFTSHRPTEPADLDGY